MTDTFTTREIAALLYEIFKIWQKICKNAKNQIKSVLFLTLKCVHPFSRYPDFQKWPLLFEVFHILTKNVYTACYYTIIIIIIITLLLSHELYIGNNCGTDVFCRKAGTYFSGWCLVKLKLPKNLFLLY